MRQIAPLELPNLQPAILHGAVPCFKLVSPLKLRVDERYQRNLTDRSVNLIRKIVAQWDWSAFKPPIVVEEDGEFHVIDGQHTAIAAVTHGGISEIPVMVVEADNITKRADAFVRHNRDRISVTPTQLHYALIAAGDEDALTIEQVCARAGTKILRIPPSRGVFRVGETLSVGTIGDVIKRRYAKGAREVLEVCVRAQLAPLSQPYIRAVEYLLFADEYKGTFEPEKLATTIAAHASRFEREAKRFAVERRLPLWRALASIIFMHGGNRRGR